MKNIDFDYELELSNYNIKINFVRRMVEGLVNSGVRGFIISGAPGIGKSHTVINSLQSMNSNSELNIIISKGHITPFQLYKTLHKNNDKNSILVFDDCDAVLDNTQSLNLLKAATEFAKERYVMWNSSVNGINDVDERVEFNGKIIILTNKKLNNNPHYKALIDRIHYYDMKVSFLEKLAKIIDLSGSIGNLIDPSKNYWDIIDYLLDNKDLINPDLFSLRDFIKLAEMKSLFGDDWKRYLTVMGPYS